MEGAIPELLSFQSSLSDAPHVTVCPSCNGYRQIQWYVRDTLGFTSPDGTDTVVFDQIGKSVINFLFYSTSCLVS